MDIIEEINNRISEGKGQVFDKYVKDDLDRWSDKIETDVKGIIHRMLKAYAAMRTDRGGKYTINDAESEFKNDIKSINSGFDTFLKGIHNLYSKIEGAPTEE